MDLNWFFYNNMFKQQIADTKFINDFRQEREELFCLNMQWMLK